MAARIAEGIRQSGHSIFLDSDREDGIAPGVAWQRTLFRELRICDVVVFLNSEAAQASMWCHSELVVASELSKRIYSLDLNPGLSAHPLLRSLQGIRFDSTIETSIRRLTDSLRLDGLAGSTRLRWERGRPPYPGLAAMDVADAGVFFGREDEVRDLVARVDGPLGQRDGDLVVVMGPSGAGKSSLVRAGLAARLAAPQSGWAVVGPFEPGIRPFQRLLSRLVALSPVQLTEAECQDRLLSEGMAAFGEWLANHAETPAKRLLITLDQAEQLATVALPGERQELLSVLGGAIGPGSPVTVVMTARSDRFDEIQRLPAIGPAIHAPVVIAPISRSQLAAVIEGPARRADLTFAPGLMSRLIDDVMRGSSGEEADALPFLAFALREMYDLAVKEERTAFTDADYERIGRIDGAIIRRTEAAEASLPSDSEPVLDRLLPQFVALSEERLPAARPLPRELLTAAEQPIVERLEDQRLLIGTGDTVRLAHERLITAWPRLAKAVASRRDDLLLEARVERQAADWKHGQGELLGRDAAIAASSWLAGRADPRTSHAAVAEYIRASQAALRRRRAQVVSVLSVIVVLALAASGVAIWAEFQRSNAVSQSHLAQSEARLAQSEEMATEATALLPADAPLGMLLSLQAYERAHTPQAESALLEAAQQPLDDVLVSGSPVDSVAFSPDGKTLAAGGENGDIGLWDVATGRRTATLTQYNAVESVAFSPDGKTLAAADDNSEIVLYSVATGQQTVMLYNDMRTQSVAFSPDGRTLAAGLDGGIGLWDVATGKQTATIDPYAVDNVVSVAFSPDGKTLAAGTQGGNVGLWDVATGRRIANLAEGSYVASVTFSPDGKTLAAAGENGDVGLWDVATGRRTATLAEGYDVASVAFSPDGKTLAAGDANGGVGLWDAATGRRIATIAESGPAAVNSVAFSPDGQTLAVGDASGDIGFWDLATGPPAALAEGSPIASVAFSPDGQTLAAGDASRDVGLWDVATGRRIATLAERSPIASVAFSPDGKTLAVGDSSGDGDIGLWNVATDRRTTLGSDTEIYSVAFSPDGKILAAGDDSGDVELWDVATGQQAGILFDGSSDTPINSVAFSPDGKIVAAGDATGDVGLWDVATGQQIAFLTKDSPNAVNSVAFSPDGKTLAVGDGAGDVGLWDVTTRQQTADLPGGSPVNGMAFSRQILVTGNSLGNVVIWDAATAQQFATLAESGPVSSLAFSPRSQVLAVGASNGNIALFRQNLANLTQRFFTRLICGKVRINLTEAQWADYASGQPYQQTCS